MIFYDVKDDAIKRRVHQIVYRAVRDGLLERSRLCFYCGVLSKRTFGHHQDYSKSLDVLWLCMKCHIKVHKYRIIISKI